jgi:flagellar hook-associated protein 3 FlgL
MRISTSWAQQLGVNAILDQQSKLSHLQMQLSTQKKILTPSDNPASTALIVDLNQNIKETEQYQSICRIGTGFSDENQRSKKSSF